MVHEQDDREEVERSEGIEGRGEEEEEVGSR
jgi:hypothetical protein